MFSLTGEPSCAFDFFFKIGLSFYNPANLALCDTRCFIEQLPMITRVFSAAVVGVDAREIEIEVNTGPGEPSIVPYGYI